MARLLVIEDNPDNLELMTYLLKAFGHEVATASDGAEGLAALGSGDFDLVVCDVHLPKMDGYEVARRLKADPERCHLPLVAVTALAMVGDKDKVLAAGFDGYIAKPISPQEFVGQVEDFLPVHTRGEGFTASQPLPSAPAAESVEPRGARILVVDNSPINRELLRSTLEPFDYRVTLAASVREAIRCLEGSAFDLVISDLHMPEKDGYALLQEVRDNPQWAPIPFMFVTASVLGGRERDVALSLGAARFIVRPIEPMALLGEVAACLEGGLEGNHGDHPGC